MKKLLFIFTMVCVLASCSKSKELKKIKVAYHPNFAGASAVITGVKKGFFTEQGLDVELVKFTSGQDEISYMTSGDIQTGYIGFGAHNLAAEGKVAIIAIDGIVVPEGIRTLKSSGLDTVDKLKGKTIAAQLGTTGEVTIEQVLKGSGITKDDVRILDLTINDAMSNFIEGKVDAISTWPPHTTQIEDKVGKDNINIIRPSYIEVEPTSSWVVTPEYLNENKGTVINFVKALYKSMDYRDNNLDEVVGYVSELINMNTESVMLEKNVSEWMNSEKIKQMLANGKLKSIYKNQIEYFAKNNMIKTAPVSIDVYFRPDIIEAAQNKK